MSTDTSGNPSASALGDCESNGRMISEDQWSSLTTAVSKGRSNDDAATVFGKPAKGGQIYRWGWATSDVPMTDPLRELSRLAGRGGTRTGKNKKSSRHLVLPEAAVAFLDQLHHKASITTGDAATAVLWSASLRSLVEVIDRETWCDLLRELLRLREAVLQQDRPYSPAHLMLAGELGLTLSWILPEIPICKRLQKSSVNAVRSWCERDEESVSTAIAQVDAVRLVLASFLRSQHLIASTTKRKLRKGDVRTGCELATWAIAMTTHTGSTAFRSAARKDLRHDLGSQGLLVHAANLDAESLVPALEAALGKSHSGGRLAWQVSLPEAIHHDPDAKVAVLMPDWDVRRGRVHIDYSGSEVQIETFGGRRQVIGGAWQTMIEAGGHQQQPSDGWSEVCEYSDDDVHYLEIEQPWSGGLLLQRQIMVIRDDRCVLMADAVLPAEADQVSTQSLQYSARLPLADGMQTESEVETREVYLRERKRCGLILPLSASEWRVGPTTTTFTEAQDRHLLLSATGTGRVFAPLWFDFQTRRLRHRRTWRQLTVAQDLRLNSLNEAAAFRVQMGSEQWVLYRSLAGDACRTFLGKHLIAEFYCSRFYPSDGSHEDLITVDHNEDA